MRLLAVVNIVSFIVIVSLMSLHPDGGICGAATPDTVGAVFLTISVLSGLFLALIGLAKWIE